MIRLKASELSFCSDSPLYDSDADPPFGVCEVRGCTEEVCSSCYRCSILLCWNHFLDDTKNCSEHQKGKNLGTSRTFAGSELGDQTAQTEENTIIVPEAFTVEGAETEGEVCSKRLKGLNKQFVAKELRNLDKEYVSAISINQKSL
nr:unnamed protein product [Callosobruchus analis]